MEMITIPLTLLETTVLDGAKDSEVAIEANVVGALAVHQQVTRRIATGAIVTYNFWVITHLPTGGTVDAPNYKLKFTTQQEAFDFRAKIAHFTDWHSLTIESALAQPEKHRALFRRIKAAHKRFTRARQQEATTGGE